MYNQELGVSPREQINLSRVLSGRGDFSLGQSERMSSPITFFSLPSAQCVGITVDRRMQPSFSNHFSLVPLTIEAGNLKSCFLRLPHI